MNIYNCIVIKIFHVVTLYYCRLNPGGSSLPSTDRDRSSVLTRTHLGNCLPSTGKTEEEAQRDFKKVVYLYYGNMALERDPHPCLGHTTSEGIKLILKVQLITVIS